VEIVSFTAQDNVTDEQILASCEPVNAFLSAQPGFLYRSLAKDEGFGWVDIIYWQDVTTAKQGSSDFMDSAGGRQFMALIDLDSCVIKHLATSNVLIGYD